MTSSGARIKVKNKNFRTTMYMMKQVIKARGASTIEELECQLKIIDLNSSVRNYRAFFSDFLSPNDWSKLSSVGEESFYMKAQKLVNKGQNFPYLLFVKEGNLQLLIDEDAHILNRIQAGEMVGELQYLHEPLSSVTILAESGARTIAIPHSKLLHLFYEDRDFEYRFLKYLAYTFSGRLNHTRQLIASQASRKKLKPINPMTRKVGEFDFRLLTKDSEILAAMILLHDVYIEEMKWQLLEHNPSQLRIENTESGRPFLIDKFTEKADWFGAFHHGQLIGCFRVLHYPDHELKEYIDIPLCFVHETSSEINRLAVSKDYRKNTIVPIMLMRIIVEHVFDCSQTIFGTATSPYPIQLFQQFGLLKAPINPFKYNYLEKEVVELLYFDNTKDSTSNLSPWHNTRLYNISEKIFNSHRAG